MMYSISMKDQIQFADIFKTFIERLHKHLYEIKYAEFTFGGVNTEYKIQCGIMTIDEFIIGAAD